MPFNTVCQLQRGLQPASCASSRSGSLTGPRLGAPPAQQKRTARRALQVHANELNKWANRDARDEDYGLPDDGFDKDTASVVLRVLTARSTQKVLLQLQELDIFVAQWLNNFAAEHPPSESKFLYNLLNAKATIVTDPTTQEKHMIDPQNLAHRILQIRADMAASITGRFPKYVEVETTETLRTYLINSTFVSGSHVDSQKYKERRGYYRQRSSSSRRPATGGRPSSSRPTGK